MVDFAMLGMVLGENEEKSRITSVQKHHGDLVLVISEMMEVMSSCHFLPTPGGADVLGNKKREKARGLDICDFGTMEVSGTKN